MGGERGGWNRRIGVLAVLILSTSLAGCGYKPCRDGDNSRFACDPSVVSLPAPVLPPSGADLAPPSA